MNQYESKEHVGLSSGDVLIYVNPYGDFWDGHLVFARAVTPDAEPKTARFSRIALPKQIRDKRKRFVLAYYKQIRDVMKIEYVEPGDESAEFMANYLYKTTSLNKVGCSAVGRFLAGTVGITLV